MATALLHTNTFNKSELLGQRYPQAPRPPPSPPMEDSKCSLPSISNLLGLADAGSPSADASPSSYRSSPQAEGKDSSTFRNQEPRLVNTEAPVAPISQPSARYEPSTGGSRPGSGYSSGFQHRRSLPPTPPLSTDASFDNYHSPSSKQRTQLQFDAASSTRHYETTPPLETDVRRHHVPPTSRTPQVSTQVPPRQTYTSTPAYPQQAPPSNSYYPHSGYVNMATYGQRSLPQAFPPMSHPVAVPPGSGPNPWQHHHYMHPLHNAIFPQTQDRYVCQTCNKAFSRPSSLRIHSHSHTGEKPFKCTHPGCGKAFSVRSNMKRHERGCHSI